MTEHTQIETTDNDTNHVDLSEEEILALKSIIKDRLWWDEASKRIKRISVIAGAVFAGLGLLAMWWPWITRIIQFIIKDVPTS